MNLFIDWKISGLLKPQELLNQDRAAVHTHKKNAVGDFYCLTPKRKEKSTIKPCESEDNDKILNPWLSYSLKKALPFTYKNAAAN